MDETAARAYRLNYVQGNPGSGLSDVPGTIVHGKNSGYQAIGLAIDHGATEIALIGFDMQATGGREHFFGSHPQGFKTPRFGDFIPGFSDLAKDCQIRGIRITNCTSRTALKCFKRQSLDDWLSETSTPTRTKQNPTTECLGFA